jgi:hypothetical protein
VPADATSAYSERVGVFLPASESVQAADPAIADLARELALEPTDQRLGLAPPPRVQEAAEQEHREAFWRDMNALPHDAQIIYLGDFALNCTPEDVANDLRMIGRTIHYVPGNHESQFFGYVEKSGLPYNVKLYESSAFFRFKRGTLFACHFPYDIWDRMQHGVAHICGHCHGNYARLLPDNKEEKILDVGVDVALKTVGRFFFKAEEVFRILETKNIKVKDHHNADSN